MMFALPKDTINTVLNYLAQRPWVEVKDLIPEVLKAKPVKIEEPPNNGP